MDADGYVVEHIIRDRLAEARTRAGFAALLRQSNERSPRANGIGHRLIELGRALVKHARTEALAISVRRPRSAR